MRRNFIAAAILVAAFGSSVSCAGTELGAQDPAAVSAKITTTLRQLPDNQHATDTQRLICPSQRLVDAGLLNRVSREEARTKVPWLKPFPPDDHDYEQFLAAYRTTVIPEGAVHKGASGIDVEVDGDMVASRVLPMSPGRVKFKEVDGDWLLCDDAFMSRASMTEMANEYLTAAKGR